MLKSITMAVVPGSETDIQLRDAATSGETLPFSVTSDRGMEIWMKCIVHGPRTTVGSDGAAANEYVLEAIRSET